MTTAPIRAEPVLAPGESDTLTFDFTEVFGENAVLDAAPTFDVVRKKGTGTLTITNPGREGPFASCLATASADTSTGSAFVITATAVHTPDSETPSITHTRKVAARVSIVG